MECPGPGAVWLGGVVGRAGDGVGVGLTEAKSTFGLLVDLSRDLVPSSSSLAAGETALEGGTSSPESSCFHSLGVSKSGADLRFDSAVCIFCWCLMTS